MNPVHLRRGLSLIEVLVSLLLLGAVVLLSLGIIIPLRVTKASSVESQALALGKSYLELVKTRWQAEKFYTGLDAATADGTTTGRWPLAKSSGSPDLKLPVGWTLSRTATVQGSSTTGESKLVGAFDGYKDTLRLVKITIAPPTGLGKSIEIISYISRPEVVQ
jgi:prepilin-type N-terminal cleavage/methylation domain-containing protein